MSTPPRPYPPLHVLPLRADNLPASRNEIKFLGGGGFTWKVKLCSTPPCGCQMNQICSSLRRRVFTVLDQSVLVGAVL